MADPRIKLTKTSVEAIAPPAAGQSIVWDSALPGFGVRTSAGGAKAFILQKRIDGRQVKRSLGRFGQVTVEGARKAAVAMSAEMATGRDTVKERKAAAAREVTLERAAEAYIRERKLKPRTVKDVEAAMRHFADWMRQPITEITSTMVEDRFVSLTEGRPTGASGKLTMRYLRAILNFASARFSGDGAALLARNPVARLSVTRRGWTGGARRRSFIKPGELGPWTAAVLRLAAEPRDALMLGLLTGVRPAEALGLRWNGVNFADATLTFADTKNGTDHELPMPNWLAAMLRARKPVSGPELVFSTADGAPLRDLRAAIARVAAESGVAFMPSDLRRTFVTTAERLDIGPYSLKRMLNHAIGGDVTGGYIVPTTDRIREPMQRVETWILGQAGLLPAADVVPLRAAL